MKSWETNIWSPSGVATDLNNGWILLAAFNEFIIGQFDAFIFIHVSEDFIHLEVGEISTAIVLQEWDKKTTFSAMFSSWGSSSILPVIL